MRSLGWALERREGVPPGRAGLHVLLVAALVLLQGAEVSGGFQILNAPFVWAAAPACWAGLGASLGFAAAQARAAATWRAVAGDAARLFAPVYLCVVLAAAFALGPISTNAGVRSYLTDAATYEYLLNLLGASRFFLPGVFEFNDLAGVVNRNVWIAPAGALVVAAACLRPNGRVWRFAPALLAAALALGALLAEALAAPLGPAPNILELTLRGDGLSLLLGGLLGVTAYRERWIVPLGGRALAAAVMPVVVLALLGEASWAASAWFRVVLAAPVGYLALAFALRRSSGLTGPLQPYLPVVLLVSFPLQQLAADRGPPDGGFLLNTVLALPPALVTAALFVRLAARRLWGERLREALAREAEAVAPTIAVARRRTLRIDPAATLVRLALGAVLLAVCFGLMAMMYLAFQPESGGI